MRSEPEKQGSATARLLQRFSIIEPHEIKAVVLSVLYFFFLFGSYSVVKPVRDAMGTVYGMDSLQELFTATLIASMFFAPLYSGLASRIKLSSFLPWVYAFVGATLLGFYALFVNGEDHERWIAAGFYVWVSTFNMLIISVFWSFMSDLFSRTQAKRLFGFIAAGGSLGGIAGPAAATLLATRIGNENLLLISAAGFVVTAIIVRWLGREKRDLQDLSQTRNVETQRTSIDRELKGGAFDGFRLLFQSRYLLLIALFLLMMTWISTIIYFQLGELMTHSFSTKEARTAAYGAIDLAVNTLAVLMQLFGTGRFIKRFGVTSGLLVNPIIMVVAFVLMVMSPVLMVLGGIQIIRRVAEYAVAKPAREMLFTVVDQESRYKAKNVIDTVVYRFGDFSAAWVSSVILPFGLAGLSIFGAVASIVWFATAVLLGRGYERERREEVVVAQNRPGEAEGLVAPRGAGT